MPNNNNGNTNGADVLAPTPLSADLSGFYQEEYEEGESFSDYWSVLRRRKKWVYGIIGGALVLTILIVVIMKPVWQGTATLQITQDESEGLLGGTSHHSAGGLASMMGLSMSSKFYKTQYAILKSPAMAYGLMDALGLQNHRSYKKLVKKYPKYSPETIRQMYAKILLKKLIIYPVTGTYLVDVSFRSTDKKLALEVPKAVQRVYMNLCMKTRQQSFVFLKGWLDKQLAKLGDRLQESEKKAIAAGQKGDFMGVDISNGNMAKMNVVLQKYVQLGQLLTEAQSTLAVKEALYDQIEQKGVDAPVIVNNPLVQKLRAQLIAVQGQASGSSQVFGPNFPQQKVTLATANEIQRKLNAEISRQVLSIKSDYQAALKAEKLIGQEFDSAKAKVGSMENGMVNFHMLERDLISNQALYEALLVRMKDAAVAATMVPSNIAVINPSEVPHKPYMPRPLLYTAIALFLGTIFGVVAAFVVDFFDDTIKDEGSLERIFHVTSLGMIPVVENGELPRMESGTFHRFDPCSVIGEAVSHIRSAIMLPSSSRPPQVILVAGCNPGDGSTTSATNIAVAFSRVKRRCLLIDCNLRSPRLHTGFKISREPGLTSYLAGEASLEQIIKPTEIPDLYLIPSGPPHSDPSGLLSLEAFREMIEELRGDYGQIVIDSPPMIGFAEARQLGSVADGVVLVLKHNGTRREAVKLTVQMLLHNNIRILGSVLTMVKPEYMGNGAGRGHFTSYEDYCEAHSAGKVKGWKKISSRLLGKDID